MNHLKINLLLAGCVAAFSLGGDNVLAQVVIVPGEADSFRVSGNNLPAQSGNFNFDPEQLRQRMIDGYREQLDVKDDAEWKVLEAAIGKVMEARRDVMSGSGAIRMGGTGAFGGGTGAKGDRGTNAPAGVPNPPGGGAGRSAGGGPGGMFAPSPEQEDLRKAIDAKAPPDEIKARLAKFREARKAREARLEKAQEDLKALLTARQEAVAVVGGLLR